LAGLASAGAGGGAGSVSKVSDSCTRALEASMQARKWWRKDNTPLPQKSPFLRVITQLLLVNQATRLIDFSPRFSQQKRS
jgi:hypothetical protein